MYKNIQNTSALYLRDKVTGEKVMSYLYYFNGLRTLTTTEICDLQRTKLIELLKYLKIHNEYYTEFITKNNIDLDNLSNLNVNDILAYFPIVNKKFIEQNYNSWITRNSNRRLTTYTTSGSTGSPFKLYHSKVSAGVKEALKYRLLLWHGIYPGQKQLYLGSTFLRTPFKLSSFVKKKINEKLILNRKHIDFSSIDDESITQLISCANKAKPVTIWGYPTIIYEVSKYLLEHSIHLKNEKLKAVVISGETHTPRMLETIQQAFQVPVVDEYNSNEGFIAGSCEFGKLHLSEESLIAEVLTETGEVKEFGFGKLLVTQLYSYDFPFIRYETGDMVEIVKSDCLCGRHLKVIDQVHGRVGDVIYNGGKKISNTTVNHYITKSGYVDKIRYFQVVQKDKENVCVKLVPEVKNVDFTDLEMILSELFNELHVEYVYTDHIDREKSGKYQEIINLVL